MKTYTKQYQKYLKDLKPTTVFLKNINDPLYWKDLSWYSKKKMINVYCKDNGLQEITDIRLYMFKEICYDFTSKSIKSIKIIIKEKNY